MDTTWMGFWIRLDNNYAMLFRVYGNSLQEKNCKKKHTNIVFYSVDLKRGMESGFFPLP